MLGRFIPDFGRIVSMMQFNMYHHYTVDEHLIRCIGVLAEIERGGRRRPSARQRDHARRPQHREVLYVALFLHDIAKGRPRTIRSPARASRAGSARASGLSAAETETVAWLVEHHLVM